MTEPHEDVSNEPKALSSLMQRSLGGPEGLGNEAIRVPVDWLHDFAAAFLTRFGFSEEEARGAAEILVKSDLRNIESHGVPRLEMYRQMFLQEIARPNAPYTIVRETPATALVDGGGGLGLVVGRKAMQLAIAKAEQTGVGLVTVTNSSHFGIAGFYAEMALAHDMIGLSMTSSSAIGVPTFGRERRLGSNPIAFAAPTKDEFPFLLDMATTLVALGKVEIAARQGRPIPEGWGLDSKGQPTTDPVAVLNSLNLTMLGSTPEMSSHKGYGLATMVDILTGVLSGAGPSYQLARLKAGHFFGAFRVDGFRDVEEFKADMDELIRGLRATPLAEDAERVYVAGEKEYLAEEQNLRLGVPLHPKVVYQLKQYSQEYNIPWYE
jgi:LDH2 family malate/lactate/ureidoglycolate dehydrogenase